MEVDRDSQEEEALIIYGCINVGEAELRGRVLLLFPMLRPRLVSDIPSLDVEFWPSGETSAAHNK